MHLNRLAFVFLSLASCGGGGSGSTASEPPPATPPTPGIPWPGLPNPPPAPSPGRSFLTDSHRFGIRNATPTPLVLIQLDSGGAPTLYPAGLLSGQEWVSSEEDDVGPGVYVVTATGAAGEVYARVFVYLPGVSDGMVVSNGDLTLP